MLIIRRPLVRALTLSLLVTLSLGGYSAQAQHRGWCACGKPAPSPPTFEIDHSVTWRWAAVKEFDRWNTYANVFRWMQGDGKAGANGKNEIVFSAPDVILDNYGIRIDSDTFGLTYIDPESAFGSPPFNACPSPPDVTCGRFSETDVLINSRFSRGWTTSRPNYNDTGPANYGATTLHELGHAIGLHHNFASLSTMNYYEDFAAMYIARSDANAARGHYPDAAVTITDIATFPFRFEGFQYDGTTVASVTPSTVQQGGSFSLNNFTVENIGSTTLSNVELRIYLSTNNIISTSDHLVGTLNWSSFDTWWDTTGRTLSLPSTVPPGQYYVGAIIFHNTDQRDSVSANNSWVLDASRRLTVE